MESLKTPALLAGELIGQKKHVFLDGPNFSGRTEILKEMVGLFDTSHQNLGTYIGPDIQSSFTGFMSTVRNELAFHCHNSPIGDKIKDVAVLLGLSNCMDNNPFMRRLSGGQEVILALLAKLALCPPILACDSCLEQLSNENKNLILKLIDDKSYGITTNLAISDNRADGFMIGLRIDPKTIKHDSMAHPRLPFSALAADCFDSSRIDPCDISIEKISFKYNNAHDFIFKNLSYELHGGKIYALQGGNGAGKSTLAKLLTGILKPVSGSIHARATNRATNNDSRKCDPSLIGYHFQDPDVQWFEVTVAKEIMASMQANENNAPDKSWFQTILKTFGLELAAHIHPFDLPPVIRKRLFLAATIAQNTPWLILDEPTLGQDDSTCSHIVRIIRNLAISGRGIIVISHAKNFLDQIADERLILDKGQLVGI